jgi:uncharacterized membrane-anchored protein YhcB (DUF1043 family)
MSEYQWLLNNGIAVVVLLFVGVVLWRVLIGTAKNGYQGVLVKWASSLSEKIEIQGQAQDAHHQKTTELGEVSRQEYKALDNAISLLVESQDPPVGAAFIAAKAVHSTAENVEGLRRAVKKAVAICRVIATQYPDVKDEIIRHCDEIERIIAESGPRSHYSVDEKGNG